MAPEIYPDVFILQDQYEKPNEESNEIRMHPEEKQIELESFF